MKVSFTPHIQLLPDSVPFIGPETLERKNGRPFKARLGANESAFGISPAAQSAMHDAIDTQGCSWYGDPENHELRSLLADKHGIPMQNICVDAGIDTLLGLSIRLFVEHGTSVVTSMGAYPTVNYHVNGYGGSLHTVPYKDNHEDPVALASAAHEHSARMVYLANPDNPMGTSLPPEAINTLLNEIPRDCLLLLDEAYLEFMDTTPAITLDVQDDRLIRFRTFSKAYGLAGMRIGYVIAHADIIAGFNRIRNHFGVNRLAQKAAVASIQDTQFLSQITKLVNQGRQRIYSMADDLSLTYLPSSTNFVAVDMGTAEKADSLLTSLASSGVFMRKPGVAPLSRFVRIGIGTESEHQYLESVLGPLLRN